MVTGFFITIIIIYIYIIQYNKGNYEKIFLDDLVDSNKLKTGDMLLFKAYNNFNSIFIGNYYGHVGIIYIDPDDPEKVPMLFEANGIEYMSLKSHHNKNGIFLSPVKERIEKYKGRVFIKSLNKHINDFYNNEFKDFILYCIKNMKYNEKIIQSAIKKWLNIEKCNKGTNCAEIVFLSLIKLGLLSIDEYDKTCLHYLKWMTNIEELCNSYKYNKPVEIVDYPFKY